MLNRNLLFVIVLRADKTVSGLAFRLLAACKELQLSNPDKVFLIVTKSLYKKVYPSECSMKNIYIVNDSNFYFFRITTLWIRVLSIISRKNIKSVHTTGNIILYPIHLLKKIFSYKTIVTFGSASIEMASGYDKRAAGYWRKILQSASAVDVLNPVNQVSYFNLKTFVSPCSFSFRFLHSAPKENAVKDNNLLFIGSFTNQKNPIFAINGFKVLYFRNKKYIINNGIKLIMIGAGTLNAEVHRLSDNLNREANNEIVKVINDDSYIDVYLNSSKVFLSLQNYTNYPSQSLLEAMLYGHTIIATDFADTNYLVKESFGNYMLADLDTEKLADAMYDAMKSYVGFNYQNANFVKTNHNVHKFCDYLIDIHNSLHVV